MKTMTRRTASVFIAILMLFSLAMLFPGKDIIACADEAYLFPVLGDYRITQAYSSSHDGLDIAAGLDTPIHATKSGTVIAVINGDVPNKWVGYGKGVVIQHSDGLYSHYAHMNYTSVSQGQSVAQGDVIGGMGTTGNSTGVHLHFAVASSMYGAGGRINVNTNAISYIYEIPNPKPVGKELNTGAGRTIPDGDYWINSVLAPNLFVDPAPGTAVPAPNMSNVATTTYADILHYAHDVWTVKYLNNGFYRITQKGADLSLDVTGAEMYAETNLQLYTLWGDTNYAQQWSIAKSGVGYTIQSRCNSFYVDVCGGKPEGGNVWLYQANGSNAQLFRFIPYTDKMFKGNGTAESPYQISSANDLRLLADLINNDASAELFRTKYYVQTADIDLGGKDFTPIGTYTAGNSYGGGFQGVYDGQCHKITGLNVNNQYKGYNGLFGWSYGGTIKNVSVYGSVKGKSPTGGIVGELGTTTLSKVINCSFTGDVTCTTGSAGGISGTIWESGYIENCYFNGTVTSLTTVAANKVSGGIVAVVSAGNSGSGAPVTIKNCYAVSDSTADGGIVGKFKLVNSASTVTISNNYFLNTMAEKGMNGDVNKGCKGLSDELMKSSVAELLGDPFVQNYDAELNGGYPLFSWQAPAYKFDGEGTAESPYLIKSKEELETFRDIMNNELQYSGIYKSYFKLTTDIDLGGEKWVPIAKRYMNGKDTGIQFCGHFDGAYHTITGLKVNEQSKFAGLFGSIAGNAVVENLAVEGTVVNTTLSTGGVVGEICSGGAIVRNCSFIGDVTGADEAVGGVVGYIWQYGIVQNCYHIGTVTCPDHSCGGVVGKAANETANTKAAIENCYHIGNVNGIAGTVVGYALESVSDNANVEVINCYGLKSDGALLGAGEIASFDAMQCTDNFMKKAASLLGDAFVNAPDSTVNNGYPILKWQDDPCRAGHTYGGPVWTWNDDNTAKAAFTCEKCSDIQTVEAKVTSETTKPTYTADGKTTYTATVEFEGEVYTDTKTVVIPKLDYNAPTISYIPGNGRVKIEWTAIDGAEAYAVAGYVNGTWKNLGQGTSTSFILNNLTAGKSYKITVFAKVNGKWNYDDSNAIIVTPNASASYPVVTAQVKGNQFQLTWTAQDNATAYAVAAYINGKWKQIGMTDSNTLKYISPANGKTPIGSYYVAVAAKVNGKWDTTDIAKRAVKVTIDGN